MLAEEIKKALQKPYQRELFAKDVLKPVFANTFILHERPIEVSEKPNKSELAVIEKVLIYGKIELEDGTEIVCYEIKLQAKVRIEQSKVAIQRYVRKLLIAGQAALVNFIAPANGNIWRLTLVAKDSFLTEKGVKEKVTHARRYTYLVGPSETCKTAAERFESLSLEKVISFESVIKAFSVEKLSLSFFNEYTEHYLRFCNYLQDNPSCRSAFRISFTSKITPEEKANLCKPIRDFTKKLLGRIVFLYFVQKKGWLGASNTNYEDGDPQFMMNLFLKSGGDSTYYPHWLTVLFFKTLNQERKDDNFDMPDGKKVKIPFLNGGLFDKEEQDDELISFDSKLFHYADNPDDPKKRGFLDFLNAYNFTVYEDSPDEHTVAVDPEMLGHIFENLLEDNKDKGAFYTPKEIVHYMCQASLIEYLSVHLSKEFSFYKKLGDDQIEFFGNEIVQKGQLSLLETLGDKALNYEDVAYIVQYKDISKLTKEQLRRMGELLDTVKICDPAIGSGAFPMGLLLEIFAIKEVIAYETNTEWKPVEVKENIIQNSIYGVDIEKGAVDIARLRFWLSLVVDETKPKPLPNLDYKIVVGNSLVSKVESEVIDIDWGIKSNTQGDIFGQDKISKREELLKTITAKQKEYFHPSTTNKKELAKEIQNIKIDILINQLELMLVTKNKGNEKKSDKKTKGEIDDYLQSKTWNEIIDKLQKLKKQKDEIFHHFDWKLDFPEALNPYLTPEEKKRGFDIVIGNPPYIQIQKMKSLATELEKQKYETFTRMGDIYSLFYEQGVSMLKENGILCFITSNKWMRADYGKFTRKFFAEKTNPILLIDFGQYQIFENATVDTNILLLSTTVGNGRDRSLRGVRIESDFKIGNKIREYVESKKILLENLSEDAWVIGSYAQMQIKKRVEEQGKKLIDWEKDGEIQINYGIKTGYNDAFIIDRKTKDELIKKDKKNATIIKPVLRGRDIQRWTPEFADLWIIGTFPTLNIDINEYPEIKKHLLSFGKKRLEQSGEEGARKKTGNDWFETQDQISYYKDFEKPKIIWADIMRISKSNPNDFPRFSYDESGINVEATAFVMTGKHIKFLLCILNSKCSSFIFREFYMGTQFDNEGVRYKKAFLQQLPIPIPTPEQEIAFNVLVDCILFSLSPNFSVIEKSDNARPSPEGRGGASDGRKYISTFESVIDAMVVDLYFPEDLKKADCYILDRIVEKVKPFRDDDTDDFKKQYIDKLYEFCLKDKSIYHGLIFRRNVEVVKTIYGGGKDG